MLANRYLIYFQTNKMSRFILLFSIICFSFICKQDKKDKEQFVEINGKKQYYLSKGTAEPVIVFVTGLGPTMDDFKKVQNTLSKQTRVICYDRAGIGKSETFNNERNLENISTELKLLTEKIGLIKPFILVGHSRGGLIARYFTDKYPTQVCALVLIDPAIPELKERKLKLRTESEKKELDVYYQSFCTDTITYTPTIRNEFKNTFQNDSIDVFGKGFSSCIPITIIASNKLTKEKYSKEDNEIKMGLINKYKAINPAIKIVLTNKSGHFIHDEEPKLVCKELLYVLKKVCK
jgi:pimeloyl-ACP methyl ester carboxylesterase